MNIVHTLYNAYTLYNAQKNITFSIYRSIKMNWTDVFLYPTTPFKSIIIIYFSGMKVDIKRSSRNGVDDVF